MSSNQHDIVIAMDLGASITKVAMCGPDRYTQVYEFGAHDSTSLIPSILYAHPDGRRNVGLAPPPGEGWVAIEWFKISLLHPDDWPQHAKHSLVLGKASDTARVLRMSTVQIVADYISQLWPGIKSFASKHVAPQGCEDFHSLSLHLILTVPACWPEDAMGRMERSVKESGILEMMQRSTLTFMREQAVAAVSLLNAYPSMLVSSQNDDLIMVCDCGGLTADAATYTLSFGEGGEHLLHERVPGMSRLCGAMFLQDGFYSCLKDKICSVTGNQAVLEELSAKFWSNASQWWEQAGKYMAFVCNDTTPVIDFPHQLEYRGRPASNTGELDVRISFSGAEFSSIREPVIDGIIDLVQSQVREARESLGRPPKYILLHGGVAANSMVGRELAGALKPPIQIINQAAYRHGLVSLGAVAQALDGRHPDGSPIVKTESHMTLERYGIRLGDNKPVHWIIEKGFSLSPTKPSSFNVPSAAFEVRKTPSGRGLALLVCRQAASFDGVRTLCRLTWMKANPVILPQDKVQLQVLHHTHRGLSLFLKFNGARIGPEKVMVDYY